MKKREREVAPTDVTRDREVASTDVASEGATAADRWQFCYEGSTSMAIDPKACGEFCDLVSRSCTPSSELGKMRDKALYQTFAQCSVQAMGAVTEIYKRMERRAKAAKTEKTEIEELVHKATQAYDLEKERADLLAIELKELRQQRKSEKEQLKAANSEVDKLRSANSELMKLGPVNEKLLAANEELKAKCRSESKRLRDSRAQQVTLERNIQDCLRKSSEATFDKVKAYLRGRSEVERVRMLYGQAKGTRETLELLREAKVAEVPDRVIASLVVEEEKYAAMAKTTPDIQLAESELVVPSTFDGIDLEVQAQVRGQGSNEGVIDQEDVEQLKGPVAQ